jgi:hypothetical protein
MDIVNRKFVNPVLSYVSRDGDVKIERRLSHAEAADLINDNTSSDKSRSHRVQIVARRDPKDKSRSLVISNSEGRSEELSSDARRSRKDASSRVLSRGKKELVFKPPANKKIANLSVSFQVV